MSIIVGQNSWVTVLEADAYLETKTGSQGWFLLNTSPATPGEPSKESYLITAFYWLLDDSFGLSASLTSDLIKRAQFEAAYFLLNYSSEYEDREAKIAMGVNDFKNSKWEETLGSVTKPRRILDILASAGYSGSSRFAQLVGEDYLE